MSAAPGYPRGLRRAIAAACLALAAGGWVGTGSAWAQAASAPRWRA
ncbi:hypothetical protein [Burkholderia gladioli]|nr:hypothetical protein [Burkholderia gladioli]